MTVRQAWGLGIVAVIGGSALAYAIAGQAIPVDLWLGCVGASAAFFFGLALLWGAI